MRWKIILKKIFVSEKELSDINFEISKHALVCIKNNFIDSDDNIYLTLDSLIDINNIITGSVNITLKINVKPCGYKKMFMDKGLIEDKLYQLVDQFNKKLIIEIFILLYLIVYI